MLVSPRFQESNLFQELFERIVDQCIAVGLLNGEHMRGEAFHRFLDEDRQGHTGWPGAVARAPAPTERSVRISRTTLVRR